MIPIWVAGVSLVVGAAVGWVAASLGRRERPERTGGEPLFFLRFRPGLAVVAEKTLSAPEKD